MEPPAGDKEIEGALSHVDPFLVETLQNPRHRLTVLRMEFDIQKFMQNADQNQFEFQNYPTSYLRCAAHRVAQHYGLQTISLDNTVDGLGSRIIARKNPDSKYPAVCLSVVPAKQIEKDSTEQVKIVTRPRPNKSPFNDATDLQNRKSSVKTVEERKEEYEKARARIFNSTTFTEVEDSPSMASADRRSFYINGDEVECFISTSDENEKISARDGASRVAIFRDMEKDRSDPDYDRSYDRYVRGLPPSQNLGLGPCNILQSPFLQYDAGFSQLGQLMRNETPVSYRPSNPAVSPLFAYGSNPTSSGNAVYHNNHMQWPSPSMISYGHVRNAMFQAPMYLHPLSFKHPQNC
ncbi:uncharacterized protein M6B38_184570 [Iris pallida]|uniref:Uncharacterized protein n=1 Tax=Iris pallida TaxID=29817 RepID=A0AAX6ELC6_IRIPA|nr:uncharacterized protein M6B38_184570 [Iris pallida]